MLNNYNYPPKTLEIYPNLPIFAIPKARKKTNRRETRKALGREIASISV